MISVTWIDEQGRRCDLLDYDPDYKPDMPVGAVRGDIRKQEFCRMCHTPRYFYIDKEMQCTQCNKAFRFGAAEQKYWYETLKFHFDSVAIRCPSCRRSRRTERALGQQIEAAKTGLKSTPDDPTLLLALSEAIVWYYRKCGQGNLDKAIAAARKVTRLQRGQRSWSGAAGALFWEASCHALSRRSERARELFERFVELAPKGKKYQQLIREAKTWLSQAAMS